MLTHYADKKEVEVTVNICKQIFSLLGYFNDHKILSLTTTFNTKKMFVASHRHEHLKGFNIQGGPLHLWDVLPLPEEPLHSSSGGDWLGERDEELGEEFPPTFNICLVPLGVWVFWLG